MEKEQFHWDVKERMKGTRWTELPSQLHFGMLVARQKQYLNGAYTRTHIEDMSDGKEHG